MIPAGTLAAYRRWPVAALALAFILSAGGALAQDEAAPVYPFSVKLGAFFPTQNNMKALASDTWWAIGADWEPGVPYRPLGAQIHAGADFVWHGVSGGSNNMLSLTGKLIWNITPIGNHPRVWGGIGGGLYFLNLPTLAGFPTVGAKFIAGVDLTDRVYVEADYDYVSGFTDNAGVGLRADGVTIAAGFRF